MAGGGRQNRGRVAVLRVFRAADRGMAMGHLDGKIAFVPFAAPGDRVEVEIVREKRRYVETRLRTVLEPSPLRRAPACPRFGECGGCQWQHLPYSEQVAAKDQGFRGLLKSRLGPDAVRRFLPPLAAPAEWGYRNRVGLKVRRIGGRVSTGFFARGSHRLVAVDRCPVAHPSINALMPVLGAFLQAFPPAMGHLPQVDIQVDDRERPWVVFHLIRPVAAAEIGLLERFLADGHLAGAFVQTGRKNALAPVGNTRGPIPFSVEAGGTPLPVPVPPGGFVQANRAVNQLLTDRVVALSDLYRHGDVLDLYAGAGNFTLPLATAARGVIAVEAYPPAAATCRDSAARAGLGNVQVLARPVTPGLHQHLDGMRPRFALLDPPRTGAAEAIPFLLGIRPGHVLYVSCSPPTLVRDLRALLAGGYRITWARIADMFPQTAHVESLVLLTGSPGGA